METATKIKRPVWYTQNQFIRRKKNHSWTEKEIKQVFTLRSKKVPVEKIILDLKLDVRKVQVYNILRMLKKSLRNKCFQCGTDLTMEVILNQHSKLFKKCPECQNKDFLSKNFKRQENLKQGKCVCCGINPPLENKKSCVYCLSQTHRHRIVEGFCGACGKFKIDPSSKALCTHCLEANRIKVKNYRKGLENAIC